MLEYFLSVPPPCQGQEDCQLFFIRSAVESLRGGGGESLLIKSFAGFSWRIEHEGWQLKNE